MARFGWWRSSAFYKDIFFVKWKRLSWYALAGSDERQAEWRPRRQHVLTLAAVALPVASP